MQGGQVNIVPMTPVVKRLIIANVSVWLGLQMILERVIGRPFFAVNFGLTPELFFQKFHVWQAFSYMFLHSSSIWHIVFNMLMLWWFGSELEMRWGRKFFFIYYVVCGMGAALIYCFGTALYAMTVGAIGSYAGPPVIGASGAVFGLLLAYGILFGERIVLFAFVFPMKVKYFVMIIGAIEVVSLLNTSSNVANLAHLGGLISGYLFLLFWAKTKGRMRRQSAKKKGRGRLKLVVNNEDVKEPGKGPKYWN